jgi:broad-specificity NMP kinase
MYGNKVEERIEGELVKLPPKELREEMSKILGKEVSKMTEEEILKKIKKIKKEELSYEELRKYNSQYQTWIYSKGMLEAEYNSSYEKDKKNGKLDFYEYKFLKNINLLENLEYIY